MKHLLFSVMFVFSTIVCGQVGIGTSTPNVNSVLELSSPNKGLLLPRVNDTTVVGNPSAGLFLYNNNTKTPSYHDGQKWNAIATSSMSMNTSGNDSLTYKFSGASTMGFNVNAQRLENYALGGSAGGGDISLAANLVKYPDINSVIIQRKLLESAVMGTLEITYYKEGNASPYRSVKFGNVQLVSLNNGFIDNGQTGGGVSIESFTFTFTLYGYKDWVSNQSFYYNIATNTFGTY